jgi:hypothetical protein
VLREEVGRLRHQLNKSAANARQVEAANSTRVVNSKGNFFYLFIFYEIKYMIL